MKNLIFYILLIAAFGFAASMPNAPAKAPNVAPTKPVTRRDTLPDELMNFVKLSTSPRDILEYSWIRTAADVVTGVDVRFNSYIHHLRGDKPINVRIIHYPKDAPLGIVGVFRTVPPGAAVMNLHFPKHGEYRIEMYQDNPCLGIFYEFRFFGIDDVTPIIRFLPSKNICN